MGLSAGKETVRKVCKWSNASSVIVAYSLKVISDDRFQMADYPAVAGSRFAGQITDCHPLCPISRFRDESCEI